MDSTITTQNSGRATQTAIVTPEQPVKGFLSAFPAFRFRNFRLFWFGQLLSLIGTWMQATGQAWLVLQLTHNSFALGLIGALQFIPVLLFTLYGGVLADRLPKRRVLLGTQLFSALLATTLGILVVTHTVQLWQIAILALLLGLTNALDMPTRLAFVGEIVRHDALGNAVALNSSAFNMAKIVGPGIAGLIIARFGEGPLFIGNALSFLPVLLGLALIDTHKLFVQWQKIARARESTFRSLQQGLVYVWKTPVILLIMVVVGIVSLFELNLNVVEPLIATDLLHQGAQGFGLISSSFGFGALCGALWVAWGNKTPSVKKMLISAISFCIGLVFVGLSHWYLVSIVLAILTGFAMIAFLARANSTLQTVAPDHLRGRVTGVYMLVLNGTTPIGNLFVGWLAGVIGISLTLIVSTVFSLVAIIVGWLKRGRADKDIQRAFNNK